MLQTQPAPQGERRVDTRAITQLVLSGLGLAFSLLAAGFLFLLGVMNLMGQTARLNNTTAMFSMGWISLLTGALCVPPVLSAVQRLSSKTLAASMGGRPFNSFRLSSILILTSPVILILGNLVSSQGQFSWLLLPPLQLLAVGLPVWWLLEIARRKLPGGSIVRGWGIFDFSVFVTTPVLMVIEIAGLVVLVILFAVWLTSQPALLQQLQTLVQQLSNARTNPESVLAQLTPFFRNPIFVFSALALLGGVIPMIEEMIKPLGVWLLTGRNLTPAEGFVAGALCGGGFALIESLFYLSNPQGAGWAVLAAGRAGTELLHITTTALIGWAMALAWRDGAYVRLGLTYLLASALHGLWNTLSLLTSLPAVIGNPPPSFSLLMSVSKGAPYGIFALFFVLLAILWGSNRRLRGELRKADQAAGPAPDGPSQLT